MTDTSTASKEEKRWAITPEAFHKLLACLDNDLDVGARRYEEVRRKLLKFFQWWGSPIPEEHTDITIDRVARKLAENEDIKDINKYLIGVAKRVYQEYLREIVRQDTAYKNEQRYRSSSKEQEEKEIRFACYQYCLSTLSNNDRELITSYYQEGGRKNLKERERLAKEIDIPINSLRVYVFRIRERLQACVNKCFEKKSSAL
jgi:DNA-directed RNA polymerase specialized sigma24 family protein